MAAAAMKHMALNFAKLDKFEGVDFRRWQKKMHFFLSSMSVVDLIFNGIPDPLFDIYHNVESSKELWGSLEAKYMAEDASSKKFLVSNFKNYNMTNSRPVMEQYNELLGIIGRFTQHKINMDEVIQVSCIIDKLSPSWKDFKHTLKHQKELTLVELGSHLRIKESIRAQDNDKPKGNNVAGPLVVNMVDHNNSSRYNDNIGKRKHQDTKANPNKKSKVTCWKCGKPGHLKKDCKGGKVGNKANGLGTNSLVDGSTNSLKVNKKYVVTFIDDASRICYVYLLHIKDEALDKFKVFKTEDGLQQRSLIKSFRTDRGGEYMDTLDVIFNENRFSSVSRPNLRIPNGTEEIGGLVVLEEKEAINEEMDSIMANNTWVLANLPPCCKPLHCKWIYQRKLKVDGTIEKFKARLVIQGFRKKSGIYYFDTYALVARISTIRLLIDLVPIHNLIIHQMDVNTTFLNGKLDEEFYMNQPCGFIMLGNENKVCKLIKSLYGLKKFDETSKGVIICLYVDEILIFGTNQVQVNMTKEFLSSRFSMKEMQEADVILGSMDFVSYNIYELDMDTWLV
ncbi:zinc finger, CCHC-type containing protein [Tanacetum coccineum]